MHGWNHNIQYHRLVMNAVPEHCGTVLDVGCGRGLLTARLAQRSQHVLGIDSDAACIAFATGSRPANAAFLHGDVLNSALQSNAFDMIVVCATLHHLPLRAALHRFRDLLRPGGVLAIVGLYKLATPYDFACAATALPLSRIRKLAAGEAEVGAPLSQPSETLREIRKELNVVMPGGLFRRRLFFRYSFLWRKLVD